MEQVVQAAAAEGFDAVVVAPSADLAYMTGYAPMPMERPTLLVLRPGAQPVMLVPQLERTLAESSPAGSLLEFASWSDGEDPYAAASRLLPPRGRIAAGDRMWASHLLGLQRASDGAVFEPASPIIGRIRAVKDGEELDALRRAAAAADETFRRICEVAFLGRREEEIAADIADLLVETGHRRADFTIVASGPNAASPHHQPGSRAIAAGDAVLMDFGGELDGYYSDTSRTVVVGEPPGGFEEVYAAVALAQQSALDLVRTGVAAQEIDRAARMVISEAGYGQNFIHRTGHGIGMEVHEPPYLVEGNQERLELGTTFSIEPGIYLPGRFGVRIEDIVVVAEGGAERLNLSSRELRIVA